MRVIGALRDAAVGPATGILGMIDLAALEAEREGKRRLEIGAHENPRCECGRRKSPAGCGESGVDESRINGGGFGLLFGCLSR
jgi:hypothetical protein